MAERPLATPPARAAGPLTTEAFIADRQRFWSGFTSATTMAVVGLVVLLILMAYFLL